MNRAEAALGFGEWGVETFDPKSNPFEFQVDRLYTNESVIDAMNPILIVACGKQNASLYDFNE
ncbi:hypothetical protein LEP1GSC188_2998 [Leptospira weilii serovar Topaz str. LT2116]|uniref:Uncharacterized protein n=1 Tax=Leptospira weilii serovar Topaz str. LT2116 TaxID=1088540 RepID=M3GAE6_9LEPT|nr:hypothetical protein LEP1GSC188_2998 [Leptospira weilii serovar Topaz str. LT2116]